MNIIASTITADQEFLQDTVIYGQIIGKVTVASGVEVVVKGLILGEVMLANKACLHLHGTVIGNIHNQGGEVHLTGILNGVIEGEGKQHFSAEAKVIKSSFIVPYYKEYKLKKISQQQNLLKEP